MVLQKGDMELSEFLYTPKSDPTIGKISPAEQQVRRKMPTVNDIKATKPQQNYNGSETDDNLEFEKSEYKKRPTQ